MIDETVLMVWICLELFISLGH